ncbi:tyrosine-type recombinase/integrase [Polyangium mundeleinium]|uniref:Tyrosine-type recombinase/integrase n=1 Tax=Polyangium mundeleinium TaxID=2995306 RepID=A0ABT5EMP8_9BACT|nr:tyrosine-type recombinase/integrase [Polyangium mundeleinium]MDC0743108.1 tyrosine-type recombinase/integrase [Polyangium mundeleinium]
MGRARKGTWKRSGDHFLVYVTLPQSAVPGAKDRRLPGIVVRKGVNGRTPTEADLDKLAKLYTDRPDLALARLAEEGRLPDWVPIELVPRDALLRGATANPTAASAAGSLIETVASYADRWLAWRDRQGYSSIANYTSGLKGQVLRVKVGDTTIGEKPIAAITRDDVKRVAAHFRDEAAAERIASHTATRYFSYFRAMLAAAADEDGDPDLYVRPDNPALGVKGPPTPKQQTRACFYPDEFLQFVSCEAIPLNGRRLVAVAVYLMVRLGELARLRCEDIDLAHERITIARSYDSARKREKAPKNGRARSFGLEINVIPLLRVMIDEAGGSGIVCPINVYKLADVFTEYLDRAGLKRADLRQRSRTHVPLTMHGLRATGATWAARSGRYGAIELRRVLGHQKQETTDVYFDEAQLMGRNVGEVFPPLPACLLNRSGKRSGRR